MSVPGYRDIVIETLADSEALLRARIASLESDIEIYRTIAYEAIHALVALRQRHDQHQERYHRLLTEYRTLREHILQADAAA